MQKFWIILPKLYMKRCNLYNLATLCHFGVYFMDFTMVDGIPVKSTDFGGSLPILLPSYRQPTNLPQSTDFYRFFRGSTEF